MTLPTEIYNERVEAGLLAPDAAQVAALPLLDALVSQLAAPRAVAGVARGFWQRLFGGRSTPTGLYLYGPVGRGKSFLMDLVFDCAPAGVPKRRLHFHQFMRDVQHRLTVLRAEGVADPLRVVANQIADEVHLLCFDEMFVKDVADAMILARLFGVLFKRGVVLVATSNIAPDDLYKGGLQRVRFLPFIDVLKKHCAVCAIDGDTDHRQMRLLGVQAYHAPLGPPATAALQGVFDRLTAGAHEGQQTLMVDGRALQLRRSARGVLFTTFDEICRAPLGPLDMLEIAACFNAVIMDGVEPFTAEMRNEAMRFITLIDALYDARRQFFMAAAVPLADLCPAANELSFDFARTASRITEMGAADYQTANI
jgi:cell division protein ZapE